MKLNEAMAAETVISAATRAGAVRFELVRRRVDKDVAAQIEGGANGATVVPTGDALFGFGIGVHVDVLVFYPERIELAQSALCVAAPI
jgi:hypothetical protein